MTTIKYEEVQPLSDEKHALKWYKPEEIVQLIKTIDLATRTMEMLDDYIWAVKRNHSFVATYWTTGYETHDVLASLDECLTILNNEKSRRGPPAANPPASPPDEPTSPYSDSWSDLDDNLAGA